MSILSYTKTVWVNLVTALGPTNQNKQEVGIENNNIGLIDLDQSNKYVLLSYIGSGLFAADTVIAFDDKKEILVELEATELDPTTVVRISVDNQVSDYLVKVGDILNSLLVSDGQGNKFTLHRDGSIAIIVKDAASKTDEIEYPLSIQSQQSIVAEGPLGDFRIDGKSRINLIKNPSYESGDPLADFWTSNGTKSIETNALFGTKSQRSFLNTTGTLAIEQDITGLLVAGRRYYVRGSIYNLDALGSGVDRELRIVDITTAVKGVVALDNTQNVWQTKGFVFVADGTETSFRWNLSVNTDPTPNTPDVLVDGAVIIDIEDDGWTTVEQVEAEIAKGKLIIGLESVENPEIKVRNKNVINEILFALNSQIHYAYNDDGLIVKALDTRDGATDLLFIKMLPNTEYTISISSGTPQWRVYKEGETVAFATIGASTKLTFTTDDDDTIYGFKLVITSGFPVQLGHLQLEIGPTETTFIKNDNSSKKYNGQILRSVDDGEGNIVKDYIDTEDNTLHELVGNDFNDVIQNAPMGNTGLDATWVSGGAFTIQESEFSSLDNKFSTDTGVKEKQFLEIKGVNYTLVTFGNFSAQDGNNAFAISNTGIMYIAFNDLAGKGITKDAEATAEAFMQSSSVEFQFELAEEVITENIKFDGIAYSYPNMTLECIQDNGFGYSWFARHSQNDPETIKLLGKALESTQKELDIYTNLKPVYQFDTDDSDTIDLSVLAKGLYSIEATLKSGVSSNSNIAITGYTGRSLALNNVALAITNAYIGISNSSNVVFTKSLLLVKDDQHSIVSELIATTILDADIDRYQSIKTDLLIESLPVGYNIKISKL